MGSARRVSLMKLRRSQVERRVSISGYLYVQDAPCFSSSFPVSSLCQCQLAYILYENLHCIHGYLVYSSYIRPSNLGHRKFAAHIYVPSRLAGLAGLAFDNLHTLLIVL